MRTCRQLSSSPPRSRHRFCVTRIVLGQKSDLFLCKILRKIFPCDFNKRSENESHKEKRRRRSRSDFFHRARLINKWASRFQPVIGKTMIHRSKIWPQIRFKHVLAGKSTSSSSFHVANLHFCGWRLKLNSLLFGQFLRFAQKKMWRGQKWGLIFDRVTSSDVPFCSEKEKYSFKALNWCFF